MDQSKVSIILVEPENPDNIGSVARAMKNTGLTDLRLVSPPRGWKTKGRKLAMSARDTLESAQVFKKLEHAVKDRNLVIGTSRRQGSRRGTFRSFQDTIDEVSGKSQKLKTAFLFGRESKGLANEHLDACDWLVTIPADAKYPSFNLSQAVLIVSFSLFTAGKQGRELMRDRRAGNKKFLKLDLPRFRVEKHEIEDVMKALHNAFLCLDYESDGGSVLERIDETFHAFIKRAGLLRHEAKMLKGLSRRIKERTDNVKTKRDRRS